MNLDLLQAILAERILEYYLEVGHICLLPNPCLLTLIVLSFSVTSSEKVKQYIDPLKV
jgi:hypothetical protein